jgi:hypothetical protein
MARIFISHSSRNNNAAIRFRDWLIENGWSDIFLDLDPIRGLAPGEKWQEELKRAADRCEAVLFLLSTEWLNSKWCLAEFLLAKQLGKRIFPIIIAPLSRDDLPVEMTSSTQIVDLLGDAEAYVRLREGLRRAGLDPESFPFAKGRAPYPGLEPLRENDAAIFFGREAQVVRAMDRLRSLREAGVERLFVILGASGAGKSSFMRAGLWPRLQRDDQNYLTLPVIRPERAPISGTFGLAAVLETAMKQPSLAGRLPSGIPRTQGDIRQWLQCSPTRLRELLAALSEALAPREGKAAPTPVIFIDQAEELFHQSIAEVEDFLALLANALAGPGKTLCIASIRSDSFPLLQAERHLIQVKQASFSLPPMLPASFRSVIEGPARLANVKLDPLLVEKLLQDTASSSAEGGDALPLLAFTLERLYRLHGAKGFISLANYESIGQAAGAISAAIDEALFAGRASRCVPASEQGASDLLKKIFLPHLVRITEDERYACRVAELTEIATEARPLTDLLTEKRLLVKDRRIVGEAEAETIEIAHEAILREWPALKSWLIAERDFLKWRARIEIARKEWEIAPKKQAALLTGSALVQACNWISQRRAEIDPDDVTFVMASVPDSIDFSVSAGEQIRAAILVGGLAIVSLIGAFGKLNFLTQNAVAFTGAMLGIGAITYEYFTMIVDRRSRVMNEMLNKVYPEDMRQVIDQKRNSEI